MPQRHRRDTHRVRNRYWYSRLDVIRHMKVPSKIQTPRKMKAMLRNAESFNG